MIIYVLEMVLALVLALVGWVVSEGDQRLVLRGLDDQAALVG